MGDASRNPKRVSDVSQLKARGGGSQEPTQTSDEFTTTQVAKLLGFSNSGVILWVKKGLLRARVTPGGHRRFKRADVDAFCLKLQRGDFKSNGLPVEQKLGRILSKPGIKKGK